MHKILNNSSTTLSQKKHNAFTLAETLITLVIIGVVAALTVPNLIIKHQKEETVTRLKKNYSVLSQAINKAIAENGPISSWDVPDTTNESRENYINKYLTPYLNLEKYCTAAQRSKCRPLKTGYVQSLSGQNAIWFDGPAFVLLDGTIVAFHFDYGFGIFADINGNKGPNYIGRDIFVLRLNSTKNRLEFNGIGNTRDNIINYRLGGGGYGCKKTADGRYDGYYCGALIQNDGWQIADDYPW